MMRSVIGVPGKTDKGNVFSYSDREINKIVFRSQRKCSDDLCVEKEY